MYMSIEIDFDVFKALTIRRNTPEITENDVLRELLRLEPAIDRTVVNVWPLQPSSGSAIASTVQSNGSQVSTEKSWICKGVTFPHGTEFKATYSGRDYYAIVDDGALVYDGERYKSPSAAATAITDTSVNGWMFWECKLPGQKSWIPMKKMRRN